MKKVHPRGVLWATFCQFFCSPVMNCSSDEEEIGSGCMFLSFWICPMMCAQIFVWASDLWGHSCLKSLRFPADCRRNFPMIRRKSVIWSVTSFRMPQDLSLYSKWLETVFQKSYKWVVPITWWSKHHNHSPENILQRRTNHEVGRWSAFIISSWSAILTLAVKGFSVGR